jgi:gamma-glutamylcyclotransferase
MFRYLAYGSNMWPPRMRGRCPSARVVGTVTLHGWRAVYDKPSRDGSAKLNIRPDAAASVQGVVYVVADHERTRLDAAEPGYAAIETPVGLTFVYEGAPVTVPPYDWYVELVEAGAREHGLTPPKDRPASRPSPPAVIEA